jgi:exopolysaccharide production protein ExoQ
VRSLDRVALFPAPIDGQIVVTAATYFELDRRDRCARRLRLCEAVGIGLLFACVLYLCDFADLIVSTRDINVAGGNIINRIFWPAVLVAGAAILVVKLPLTLRVLRVAWPSLLILGWFAATTLWAEHPGLALRRAVALAVSYFALLSLAVGLRSPRSLQVTFLGAFAVVMLADLLALGVPSYSYTELGVRGIHIQKNSAGHTAVLAFAGIAFALPRLRPPVPKLAAGILALWCVGFLYLTKSKTSLSMMVVLLSLMPLYYLWIRGDRIHLIHFNVLAAIGSVLVFVTAAAGMTLVQVGQVVAGDLTFTGRTYVWRVIIEKIAASPWVGFGFGSIWDVGAPSNPFGGPKYEFWNDPQLINEAHNGYLDLLLHGGVVALGLALFIALRALWLSSVLATHPAISHPHRYAFCMLHSLVVVYLLNNLLESSLFFPSNSSAYFFLVIISQLERWKAELDAHQPGFPR